MSIEKLRFLAKDEVREIARVHGTPLYVYSRQSLESAAREVQDAFREVPYGLTVRYAMKANPYPDVLRIFNGLGVHVDASSEYEAAEAVSAGFDPSKVLLTSQQLPRDIRKTMASGIEFTATSLHQLEVYGALFPGTDVSMRLNTGLGSGMSHRLTTGGIEVGFGIWYHDGDTRGDQIQRILDAHNLRVKRIHIHIGTGSDPTIWAELMKAGLRAARDFPSATILNLGGGFKLAYMQGDKGADLVAIGQVAAAMLREFAEETGRELHLEIEPGRYLVARAGAIISQIIDETDTGEHGDHFLKLDTGMSEIIRTAMYGAQHPLIVVSKKKGISENIKKYVVLGHCCESSDVFTTVVGNPEKIEPRPLGEASIGDYVVIEMAGAYCASMSAKRYNSFPEAKEIMV